MIELQAQLAPSTQVLWGVYEAPHRIEWLHEEKRDLSVPEQIQAMSGLKEIHPTAVVTLGLYLWEDPIEW